MRGAGGTTTPPPPTTSRPWFWINPQRTTVPSVNSLRPDDDSGEDSGEDSVEVFNQGVPILVFQSPPTTPVTTLVRSRFSRTWVYGMLRNDLLLAKILVFRNGFENPPTYTGLIPKDGPAELTVQVAVGRIIHIYIPARNDLESDPVWSERPMPFPSAFPRRAPDIATTEDPTRGDAEWINSSGHAAMQQEAPAP